MMKCLPVERAGFIGYSIFGANLAALTTWPFTPSIRCVSAGNTSAHRAAFLKEKPHMTDNLDDPWICKMSRRDKMKHLQSVCLASTFQTNPMSEAKLVKDRTSRYVPSTLAVLQKHFLESRAEHGLEFQGLILKKISSSSSKERTTLSRAVHLTPGPRS